MKLMLPPLTAATMKLLRPAFKAGKGFGGLIDSVETPLDEPGTKEGRAPVNHPIQLVGVSVVVRVGAVGLLGPVGRDDKERSTNTFFISSSVGRGVDRALLKEMRTLIGKRAHVKHWKNLT